MVRLSGESGCEGQLEVQYQNSWSGVLQASWSFREASVVCRQLGCGSAVKIYNSTLSGTRHTDVCLTGYQCSGTETHLVICSAPHMLSCSSSQYVSIVCSKHRSLRLVGDEGGCAGRLEVFHQGSWGTVCDDSWDLNDAQVVCRQFQCGTALRSTSFGPGNGSVWLTEVGCVGNESSLWDCPAAQWGHHDCVPKEDVGVVCSEYKDLRLAEGCSGHLEVYYNGTWGNVCFNEMDTYTASLICQQLNCGKSGTVSRTESRLKGAPNWMDSFQCRLHDSTLWQCPSSPWGQNRCDEDEVAFITCEPLYQGGLTHLHEAIYEETEYNLTRGEMYRNPRKGSVLSEDLPSGYEDVEDSEGDPPSGTDEKNEYYDDAFPVENSAGRLSGLMGTEETAEDYDDVAGAEQSRHFLPGEKALTTRPPGDGPPGPDHTDYDDVGDGGSSALQAFLSLKVLLPKASNQQDH